MVMPYPLDVQPRQPARYFRAREEWRMTDVLMNPMNVAGRLFIDGLGAEVDLSRPRTTTKGQNGTCIRNKCSKQRCATFDSRRLTPSRLTPAV